MSDSDRAGTSLTSENFRTMPNGEVQGVTDGVKAEGEKEVEAARVFYEYYVRTVGNFRFRPRFQLPHTLRFKDDFVSSSINGGGGNSSVEGPVGLNSKLAMSPKPTGFPEKLFSVVMDFSHSKLYAQIPQLQIPYLCSPSIAPSSLPFSRGASQSMITRKTPATSSLFSIANEPQTPELAKSTQSSWYAPNTNNSTDGSEQQQQQQLQQPYQQSQLQPHKDRFDGFPYAYNLMLVFEPLVPLPASFSVTLTFNDGEGNICEGTMDTLQLLFSDLFLPLPPPFDDSMGVMWDQLWKRVLMPNLGMTLPRNHFAR